MAMDEKKAEELGAAMFRGQQQEKARQTAKGYGVILLLSLIGGVLIAFCAGIE